jgi:hypothetical protein
VPGNAPPAPLLTKWKFDKTKPGSVNDAGKPEKPVNVSLLLEPDPAVVIASANVSVKVPTGVVKFTSVL